MTSVAITSKSTFSRAGERVECIYDVFEAQLERESGVHKDADFGDMPKSDKSTSIRRPHAHGATVPKSNKIGHSVWQSDREWCSSPPSVGGAPPVSMFNTECSVFSLFNR